ncbi:MAG: hypothetical protein K0Q97_3034, partial [Bacillota bacterium]|nr:hypothetical protein [Bacillota bacterium]
PSKSQIASQTTQKTAIKNGTLYLLKYLLYNFILFNLSFFLINNNNLIKYLKISKENQHASIIDY